MADIICEPNPGLLESMRSVGYDLNTAVADVIDNSIAAGANNIDIRYCDYGEKPYIAIVDDGNGMDRETAIHAMQLAGTNSEETRSANDLGRFGLGLKTASLSQCRSLMVTSLQHGNMSTFRWDLDHVAQTNSWTLEELSRSYTYVALPAKVQSLMPTSHGTCVLWRKLDRLSSVFGRNVQDLDRAMHDLNFSTSSRASSTSDVIDSLDSLIGTIIPHNDKQNSRRKAHASSPESTESQVAQDTLNTRHEIKGSYIDVRTKSFM